MKKLVEKNISKDTNNIQYQNTIENLIKTIPLLNTALIFANTEKMYIMVTFFKGFGKEEIIYHI